MANGSQTSQSADKNKTTMRRSQERRLRSRKEEGRRLFEEELLAQLSQKVKFSGLKGFQVLEFKVLDSDDFVQFYYYWGREFTIFPFHPSGTSASN